MKGGHRNKNCVHPCDDKACLGLSYVHRVYVQRKFDTHIHTHTTTHTRMQTHRHTVFVSIATVFVSIATVFVSIATVFSVCKHSNSV
jgi:hypothetical protein